jgi:crossover junction endodeoxyribonuclease RusA
MYRSVIVRGHTRVLLSKQARDYHAMVRRRAMLDGWPTFTDMDRLEVIIHARPPDRRARDLDNLLKATLDAVVKAGLIPNDSQIDKLAILRGTPIPKGSLTVGVARLP